MTGSLLRNILLQNSTVKAITSTVHPSSDPQASGFPKIVYELVSGNLLIDNDGVHASFNDYQIDCYAKSYFDAEALAVAVSTCLQLYSGSGIKKVIVKDQHDNDTGLDLGKDKQAIFRKTIRITVIV